VNYESKSIQVVFGTNNCYIFSSYISGDRKQPKLRRRTSQTVLSLSYYKNNGYGFGNDINGIWTITALVSQNASYVTFYLDNQLQQNDSSSPFSWNFNTNNYNVSLHTINVTAYDSSGEAETVEIQRNFAGFPTELVIGIIGLVIAIIVVLILVAAYQKRKNNKEKQIEQ